MKKLVLLSLLFTNIFFSDNYNYYHNFKITAYCPGPCCNDQWAGMTAIGVPMQYYFDRNINVCAVDPKIIPLRSEIIYNGTPYLCVDTGGKIKGYHIDLLMKTHEEAKKFGVKINQTIGIKN